MSKRKDLTTYFKPLYMKVLLGLKKELLEPYDVYSVYYEVGKEAGIEPLRVWWYFLEEDLGSDYMDLSVPEQIKRIEEFLSDRP